MEESKRESNFSLRCLNNLLFIGASSSLLLTFIVKGLKTKSIKHHGSFPYIMSSVSSVEETVDVSSSEVTPLFTFAPVSDMLTLMSEALVASVMDLSIGTSGGVVMDEVVGGVVSVKMVEVNGTKI